MIIFGTRGFAKILATLSLVCANCHNPAAHHVVRRSRWFTLFFIPVFPVYLSRTLTCTYCGHQSKLSKQQADELLAGTGSAAAPNAAAPNPAAPTGQLPPPGYTDSRPPRP